MRQFKIAQNVDQRDFCLWYGIKDKNKIVQNIHHRHDNSGIPKESS